MGAIGQWNMPGGTRLREFPSPPASPVR